MPVELVKWEYEATIAANQSVSSAVHLDNANLVGLIVPAAWTAAPITAQGSRDNSNWSNLRDADGAELTFTVAAAGDWIVFPAGAFNGIEFIRFRSGTSAVPVNQAAERTLIAVCRGYR